MTVNDNCENGDVFPIDELRVRGILRIHQPCDPDECARKATAQKWADEHQLSDLPS